jgi:hypothetical protein
MNKKDFKLFEDKVFLENGDEVIGMTFADGKRRYLIKDKNGQEVDIPGRAVKLMRSSSPIEVARPSAIGLKMSQLEEKINKLENSLRELQKGSTII